MAKIKVKCSWCGQSICRYPSQIKVNKNFYCSGECRSKHISKKHNPEGYTKHEHLAEYNKLNNKFRMNLKTRIKLRNSRLGKGEGKSYKKIFGVHEHRVIASIKIGRALRQGEVVHHIDGDRRNNDPENLQVFSSQSEHAQWHRENDLKVGDA